MAEFKLRTLEHRVTLTVGIRELKVRLWIALQLFRLGAAISGMNFVVVKEDEIKIE